MTPPKPRRPWLLVEKKLARALAECRFPPATFDKRFARDMVGDLDAYEAVATPGALLRDGPLLGLTEGQAETLVRLAIKYRRQIDPVLVRSAVEIQADRAAKKVQAAETKDAAFFKLAAEIEERAVRFPPCVPAELLGDPRASTSYETARIQREIAFRQLGLPLDERR